MTKFKSWAENFKWESTAQEQGFGAYLKWLKELSTENVYGFGINSLLNCTVAWLVQKDHESNDWWRETVAGQVGRLEVQIKILLDRIEKLENQR